MLRVLLVIDDYNELVYLQSFLKKMGFDVDGIQNQRSFDDHRLSFNPEVVLATAMGPTVNGLELAEKIKRPKGLPKMVLVLPTKFSGKSDQLQLANVDASITTPVNPRKLLAILAEVGGLEEDTLMEKYSRIRGQVPGAQEREASGKAQPEAPTEVATEKAEEAQNDAKASGGGVPLSPSKLSDEERKKRFQKSLDELDEPEADGFPRERVVQYNKDLRASLKEGELDDLEQERQDFVRALFNRDDKKS